MQWSGGDCERSERRGGLNASGASSLGEGERSERRVGGWRAKRAACECVASEASGGGAAGRPRIVAEGDILRVFYISEQSEQFLFFRLSIDDF